jgi:hypothetical protein
MQTYTWCLQDVLVNTQNLDVYPLLQILATHVSANSIPQTRAASSAAWERTTCWSVAHVNASWITSKRAWIREFA